MRCSGKMPCAVSPALPFCRLPVVTEMSASLCLFPACHLSLAPARLADQAYAASCTDETPQVDTTPKRTPCLPVFMYFRTTY